jgi:predicted RNA binding protein YcfA (HicA-like mRNA interferase family)
MQRTELERLLRKGGWIVKSGGKHNYVEHPNRPGVKITLPRGSKINDITAKGILQDAGLK